jgi:hypothetical protein
MQETKSQGQQGVARPALKPFVRPRAAESPALRPKTPAFGRVTLPPFGPIRYGGPKPGAAVVPPPRQEDDEAPTWASIEEYVHTGPAAPEAPEGPEAELVASEPEPEPYAVAEPERYVAAEPEPVAEAEPAEAVSETVEDATGLFDDELPVPTAEVEQEQHEEPMPWEAAPEPEPLPVVRRPVLPLTGPSDPTPIMNPTIERTTEPHRMTPMRVTPLRPSMAIPPTPTFSTASTETNARAVAAALEMVAGRVRRGDLVVSGSMPTNDDPPALAAVLAATAAALLGVRN